MLPMHLECSTTLTFNFYEDHASQEWFNAQVFLSCIRLCVKKSDMCQQVGGLCRVIQQMYFNIIMLDLLFLMGKYSHCCLWEWTPQFTLTLCCLKIMIKLFIYIALKKFILVRFQDLGTLPLRIECLKTHEIGFGVLWSLDRGSEG